MPVDLEAEPDRGEPRPQAHPLPAPARGASRHGPTVRRRSLQGWLPAQGPPHEPSSAPPALP